jgi:hypothetical protein
MICWLMFMGKDRPDIADSMLAVAKIDEAAKKK